MFLSETVEKKWQPILEHPDLPKIKDSYRRAVTSVVLENQEKAIKEDNAFLSEAGSPVSPSSSTGASINNYDPILISLVRRAVPNLIAYDICGVQPMTGPTGLIFAMRARYDSQSGAEAMYNEADTGHVGAGTHTGAYPVTDVSNTTLFETGTGMTTGAAEAL